MRQRGFGSTAGGLLSHPVSQAADITAFGAHLVPVAASQLPVRSSRRSRSSGASIELVRAILRDGTARAGRVPRAP